MNIMLTRWQRLHAALMPDYNGAATAYWWAMVAIGMASLAGSAAAVVALPLAVALQIFACVALATLAGCFPVKISRTNQAYSAGDLFIFVALLTYGAPAACLAAGAEAFVTSSRTSPRWTTRLGSATIAATSMLVCASTLRAVLGLFDSAQVPHEAALLLASMAFGSLYLVLNTVLMTTTGRLKRGERLSIARLWQSFGWVAVASAGTGAVAALLHIAQRQSGFGVLVAILPIIAMLFTTLHFFFRHQEAQEVVRQAEAAALQNETELEASRQRAREAEQAARHVRELRESEQRFHSAFTYAAIGMALVSLDGRIRQANPALHALLGLPEDGANGRAFADFVAAEDAGALAAELARVATSRRDSMVVELRCQRPGGDEAWVHVSSSFFSEPGSPEPCLIVQLQDITARKRAEAELQHRAFHDKLTGLHNRDHFYGKLAGAIEASRTDPKRHFAVLFIDLDRFKLINDSKGHIVGDEFLVRAARRIEGCLRTGDELARLGGDEFAILAANLADDNDAIRLADRLLHVLQSPLVINEHQTAMSASIGITFSSMGYAKPEDMLRDADIAMYKAKVGGKARYALFDVRLHTDLSERVRLEGDLRRALAAGELSVVYQPLFELSSGRLTGFEALARWYHPELGPISPATFVAIADESGMIVQLTEFVLQTACEQLTRWHVAHPEFADLGVHVNVAGPDISKEGFVATVASALRTSGLRACHLTLELTENILMAQLSAAMGRLGQLRDLGVSLSVDDFGTGYSSLSHLSILPIDSLKIDMSFVSRLRAGSKEVAVIHAIVLLGKALGKAVIAEGIETRQQLEQLRELECEFGQGYFLARPLGPPAIDDLLRSLSLGLPAQQVAAPKWLSTIH